MAPRRGNATRPPREWTPRGLTFVRDFVRSAPRRGSPRPTSRGAAVRGGGGLARPGTAPTGGGYRPMSRGAGTGSLSRRFGTGPAAGRARPGKRPGLLDRADAQREKTSNIDVMRARLKKINSRLDRLDQLHNPATSRPASSASAPAFMSRPSTSGSRPSTSGSLWVDYGSLSHHGADPLHFKQEVRRRALAWIAAEERIFRTIVSDNYMQLVKTEIAIIKEDMGRGKFAKSKGNSGYSFEELVAKLARHRVSRKISLELERRKLDEWNLPQVMKCVSKEYMAGIRQRAKEMGEDMAGQSDLLSLSSSIPLSSARKRGARDRPTLQAQDSIVEEISQVTLGEEEGEDLLLSPTSNVTPGSIMEKVLEWTPSVKKKQSLRQGQQWELPLKPRAGETPGDMYVRTCELEGMPPTPQVREQLNRPSGVHQHGPWPGGRLQPGLRHAGRATADAPGPEQQHDRRPALRHARQPARPPAGAARSLTANIRSRSVATNHGRSPAAVGRASAAAAGNPRGLPPPGGTAWGTARGRWAAPFPPPRARASLRGPQAAACLEGLRGREGARAAGRRREGAGGG